MKHKSGTEGRASQGIMDVLVTQRLYYEDARITEFDATLNWMSADRSRIHLDRTFFYPTSGGQPHDIGQIGGVPVVDVVDEGDEVTHVLAHPLDLPPGAAVRCAVGWDRRWDHMQQHTGQHLLSAVFEQLFGIPTVGFHMGADVSTIELACPELPPEQVRVAELRANEIVQENRPVTITFEDADSAEGLRRASKRSGVLRIVTIADLDRSACGGTHLRSTAEVGYLALRGSEKIRGNIRLQFVCGQRAVRRARADHDLLSAVASTMNTSREDAPRIAEGWAERLREGERNLRRLGLEAAGFRGREAWAATQPSASGLRVLRRDAGNLGEEVRAEAQAFTSGSGSVFVATATDGKPAILLAVSADSGIHAGELLKPLLERFGGRGGGSAPLAQGTVGTRESLEELTLALTETLTQRRPGEP